MKRRGKHKEAKSNGLLKSILLGSAVTVVMGIVLSGVIALLIVNENIAEYVMPYAVFAALLVSALAGGVVAVKTAGQQFALVALGVSGVAVFTQLAATVFFFESSFHNVLTSILAMLIGSGISCAVCISTGQKNRKRKYRHR